MATPGVRVICCPREWRPVALHRLHADLPDFDGQALAESLMRTDPADEPTWAGLLIAVPHNAVPNGSEPLIEGAVWVQSLPGNSAVVWPPAFHCDVAEPLLRAAATFVDERQIPLAQWLVGRDDSFAGAVLIRNGFPRLAELIYLVAEAAIGNQTTTGELVSARRDGLEFVPRAGDHPTKLAAVLEQTYVGTRDCPGLDGVRTLDDALDGYRAQGRHCPEHWYFVRLDNRDIGALLLSDHPDTSSWELIYMGLVPAARGRGLGAQIARFAVDAVFQSGAERLVVAVDAENAPAIAAYSRVGFHEWDRRAVHARLRKPE